MTDVLLRADVFQQFRQLVKRKYDLDSKNVYTAPGLPRRTVLETTTTASYDDKMTKQLDSFTNADQHLSIEKGIRLCISIIFNWYAKANNPEVPDKSTRQNQTRASHTLTQNYSMAGLCNVYPTRGEH